MTQVATLAYAIGMAGLFLLNRERSVRTSKALWLPVVWLLINSSRPVSVWLGIAPNSSNDLYLDGSPLDRNVYLTLVVIGVIILWGRQVSVIRCLRANQAVIAFFLYCAVSSIWSDHPDVALKRWIKAAGEVVMVLITLTDREPLEAVKRVLTRAGFILIPASILLIKYYPDMSRYYSKWEGKMFVSGVAEDKNMLGMTCLVFGLGALWRLVSTFRERKGKKRTRLLLAHGVLLSMVIWLLWLSNSMTSISCFVLAAGVLTTTSLFRLERSPVMIHILVAAAICFSFSVLFLSVGGAALETVGRNSTLTGRTEIWRGLLAIASDPVLGVGFQSFWIGEHLHKVWQMGGLLTGINESHNGYLEIFLNLGLVGLAFLAGLLATGYRNISRNIQREPAFGGLRLGFFVIAVIYAFTEASGFGIMNPVWFALMMAIIQAPRSVEPGQDQRGQRAGLWDAERELDLAHGEWAIQR
jgi:exopolysaccharide production protein ExoQ